MIGRAISKNSTEACDFGHTYNTERLDLFVREDQERNNHKRKCEKLSRQDFWVRTDIRGQTYQDSQEGDS